MEKQQRRFDQQLAEERAQSGKIASERDAMAQESRDRETKVLSLGNELETLKGLFEDSERQRRALQLELDDLISSKDDVGKNVRCSFIFH